MVASFRHATDAGASLGGGGDADAAPGTAGGRLVVSAVAVESVVYEDEDGDVNNTLPSLYCRTWLDAAAPRQAVARLGQKRTPLLGSGALD